MCSVSFRLKLWMEEEEEEEEEGRLTFKWRLRDLF